MKKIYFVTTNTYKFNRFSEAIRLKNIRFQQLSLETPEVQASNNRIVAEFSAAWAAQKIGHTVIKEDIGMYIHALGGFPGPYLSEVEKQIKTDGFLRLMNGVTDRSAYWEYAVACCDPGKKPVSFYTQHKGTIAFEARGKSGWHADKIFVLGEGNLAIAELLDAKKYVRNQKHYHDLAQYIQNL